MGIFNVSIPLLYGEGEKAFTRLQEEIMRSNYDQSVGVESPLFQYFLWNRLLVRKGAVTGNMSDHESVRGLCT